ncbi:hypothetical protein [Streptomyces sp. NPDC007905]|uniref:hypothetical protein n=1 Tax=Streptomyces sp. NPDC007905 TaxID=3364788 RepID=UPI0036EAFB5C
MRKRLRTASAAAFSVLTLGVLSTVVQGDIDWPHKEGASISASVQSTGIDWPAQQSAAASASAGNDGIDWP